MACDLNSVSDRASCALALLSCACATCRFACDWARLLRGRRGSMEASSWPAFTSSPVCTFISMISPEAFDLTSTVSTGSMAPDADADTTSVRRETGTASYVGAAWGLPQAMTPASTVTAAREYVFVTHLPFSHRARSCRRADESGGA